MMLTAKKLSLGYIKPITQEFNLEIPKNQWIGVIGDNGTGKSTFFKTMLGIIKPKAGQLLVLGKPCGKSNKKISYIPQEREINLTENMTGLTLINNSHKGWSWGIPFSSRQSRENALELLHLVGAQDYMSQPFFTLSGGQKKRIFLAQALIDKPEMLLLDEPLADLDPNAKQHFIQALQAIHKHTNISLLIISHDMHEIAMHLDGFIHFKSGNVHLCKDLPCIKEDVYVGI
ncbi:MAG: zinc/manganese transport system ATP-binding protein [Francisellaceae bacterium]|jgi:zinc/manganese transport system ATP-binding protein